MKTNKLIQFWSILLVFLTVLGVGNAWGAIANPYSFTFASGDLTTSSTSFTKGEVTWSLSATENSWNGNANQYGYRFGSADTPKPLTVSTSGISGAITQVTVTGRSNNKNQTATVSVTVGSTEFTASDDTWDNGNNQTLTFTGCASGTISVHIEPDACGHILYGISVTYSTTARTVTFNKQGGTFDDPSVFSNTNQITEASAGAGVTLPLVNPSSACASDRWGFYGWATSAVGSSTTTAPTIVGKAGDTYYPSANTTLYAVFAQGEYTKETSTITDDAKYLIVATNSGGDNYILKYGNKKYYDAENDEYYTGGPAAQINETSSGKYAAYAVNATWAYTLDQTSSSYYIRDNVNAAASNYVDFTYSGTWYKYSSSSVDHCTFSVSDGVWSIKSDYDSDDFYFGFDEDEEAFFAYGSPQDILLYKAGTINYWSNPSCCEYEVSVSESGSSHITSMAFSESSVPTCGDATSRTITITVTPASGYTLFGTTKPVFTKTSGTVAATIGSVTDNGDGTFSYECTFNSNDNGAGTFAISPGQFTNYRTVCCTELGTIDGEASLTQAGNSVTISGWSDVSNVGTYTVKLYKKNGASWDLVSGTTSGGSAGAQGTRTGITSGSKSVTYTGLEVESEYKFTVQAIAGSSAYCDGVETDVTEINDVDVSSTPFKFRYAIYIDDGTNDNYTYHYITSTGNTNEGSVDIDLSAHVDYYQFKIAGGFSGWWGQTGTSKIPASTEWELDGSYNVNLNTGAGGSYTFTVDYSSTNPAVTVTFPSADQDAGYVIYYDNSVLNWSSLYYRVGNNSSCSKVDVSLVPGTDKFYKVTTPDYDNMDAWHLANNYGWTGSNSIYRTKTSSDPAESPKAITNSIAFQQYAVTEDITVIPTTTHSTGGDTGDAGNSNCEFYTINTPTSGMLTHNAAITSYSHGTVTVAYTNTSGSAASFTSGNADLAHRCVLTITATPATGYSLSSLQVNSSNFTSGNEHILTADATITAVFTAQTSTVTLQATSATTGSDQTVLATYDASMPLVTTADKTPAVAAISRTGYTFNGWWDATSGGKQYYSHSAGTIASANNWDKTGSQTLYAQWIAKEYTITLDREGGSTGAESATATFDSETLTGWSAPTKTGYTFGGYYSGDNGTGTLVISSTGVLQNSVTISAVNWTDASGHWIKDDGVTVYAKWTANEYTISYKDEGNVDYSGSNSALLPTTHTYGAATDLVDGVKSGYRFDGWFDNSSCTGSAITTIGATAITANTTYYAKWTEVYTVTWHVNGEEYSTGVVTGNSQVPDGEKISDVPTAPADNTLNNCANKFMGWSSKNATSTPKTTSYYDDLFTDVEGSPTISDDIDFYAVFAERDGAAENTTIWSENWTGATSGTTPTSPTASGSTVYPGATITYTWTPATGSSTGNTQLDGNNYAGGSSPEAQIGKGNTTAGKLTISDIPSAGATKLTVSYKQNAQSLTASVSGPGYSGSKTSSTKATQSFDVTVGSTSTFTLTFTAGSSNVRVDNVEVKVKTTSYSNYVTECAANQVRVTYDFNGGTGTACSEGVTTKNANYTVCSTTPTKNYYDFAGWNDGTSTYNAGATGYNLASSTTFTAQWTPTTYDITYELDGGTNDGDNPATYNVTTETITLEAPTRGHDRFDGWFTEDGVWSDEVTEIPLGSHGDITLYAKWSERHEIVFDYSEGDGGTTTTIYRADDENLEDAVAGMGSVPDDPDAPSACSSKVFVGWSESEIDDETDTKPSDLMKSAVGTVNEDKEFHAVWAIVTPTDPPVTYAGTGVFEEITSMGDLETGTYYVLYGYDGESTHGALKNAGSGTAGEEAGTNMTVSTSSITNPSTDIVWKLGGTTDAYTLYNQSASKYIEITTDDAKGFALNASATTSYKVTVEDGHGFFFKTNKTGCTRGISIYTSTTFRCYALANAKNLRLFKLPTNTVTAYCTSCCATEVTLSQNSPSNGTIEFGKTKVGTCGDKEVSLTITPAAGYQLHTYEVATGSGKVATKSVSPAISLDNNSSAAQNITLTFADEANGAYDVTASFSKMAPTAWAWTYKSEAIPNPINLYVGQTATLNATYTPSGLLNSEQNYNVTKSANLTQTSKTYATPDIHYTFRADATMDDGTVTLTNQINSSLTITVHVHVDPLPLTHFEDLVHGKAFADVEATLVDNALSATKTTPTSDDWTTPNANECEENHLHLVGWIREDWPALVAYLAGTGDAPTTTAIVGAGNDGSGNAYFFAPNASINVQTFDGVTFYAVWAEIK